MYFLFKSAIIFIVIISADAECAEQYERHISVAGNRDHRFKVVTVIDGDTIEIEGGQRVRYLGIDTPETGQPFYLEAMNKNKELVLGKLVRLDICKKEPFDKYGRILAYVYIDQTMVNKEFILSGFARTLMIPPCGVEMAEEFRQYQKNAMLRKAGLWGRKQPKLTKDFISVADAMGFIDERKAIFGRVKRAWENKKAVFIEIGNTDKTELRVVIFNKDKKNFEDDKINPLIYYQGKEIVVYGRVKIFKGRLEIIVNSPFQLEVW